MNTSSVPAEQIALVLSGGVGLGAYQAGAYAALHERDLVPRWIAGSSVGAVNAALIAGNPPKDRLDRLREFWKGGDLFPLRGPMLPADADWRHLQNWMSAIRARLFGAPGLFFPRFAEIPFQPFVGLYDLSPMRRRLEKLVDFDRLNSRETRVSIATTDIETGDSVVFDTAKGSYIGIEHILASCGFLPEFAPLSIEGRTLGDGGLSANAPVEPILMPPEGDPDAGATIVCFVIDLFARDGPRPDGLESALQRKNDLLFGNQTFQRLQACQRQNELLAKLERSLSELRPRDRERVRAAVPTLRNSGRTTVFYLSYHAPPEEAGPEKPYDLSRNTLASRWRSGELDMQTALGRLNEQPRAWLTVVRRPAGKAA